MASAYEPIAGISANNQGPINTVATVILVVTSALFSAIRFMIGRQKGLNFEIDDTVFGVALILAIISSVMSQRMVPVGLGQHQAMLPADTVDQFFKVQYATSFLIVLSMATSKASLVLMFRRLAPQLELTTKVLLPVIVFYAIAAIFLVAFQCDLPRTWVLGPSSCSTGGRTLYGAIGLNILTDVILAFWIVPTVYKLQAARSKKGIVIALVTSRLVVCIADGGRFAFVRQTLNSDDITRSSLGWAVMDQVIVHLSLNHATLPRVQNFLTSLQTGLLVPRLITDDHAKGDSYGAGLKYGSNKTEDNLNRTTKTGRSGFFSSMKHSGARNSVSIHADAHDSKTQLRLQPDHGNELATFVTVGDAESTSSAGNTKHEDKGGAFETWAGFTETDMISSLPSQQQGIVMHHTVEIREERA